MIRMSEVASRPLNWNVIVPGAANVDSCLAKLEVGSQAAARGAKVVGLTMPVDMKARFSFLAGFVLDGFEGWAPILALPVDARLRALRDPDVRRFMANGASRTSRLAHMAAWDRHVLLETFAPRNASFRGRRVGNIAAEQGKDPFDALLDIVVADRLRTTFTRSTKPPTERDWEARLQIWRDPRAVIGASDAGAHLDMIAAFRYATGFLEEGVRVHGLLTLEEAVRLLTGAPARLYGLCDRGTVREGAFADVVVFDPDTVGSEPVGTRFDLPGGAGRLYAAATGIGHVLVNGVEIAADGEYTGVRAGTLLRSGRDTHTPTMEL
jgi:N-acyl-D-aspartate/D-glutamate deacylase